MSKTTVSKVLIERLGGTTKTAKLFGVEPPSVCGWKKNGIPKPRMMFLRLAYPEWFDKEGNVIIPNSATS